jgi:Lon protease-like protein
VALIVVHQALPDGRSNILVEGESRFVIEDVEGPHPYFVATVSTFTDEQAGGILPGDTADSLRRLGNRCRAAVAALTDEPGEEGWAADAERLTFQVAGTLPWSSEQARELLRSRSAEARADLLLKVLPRLLPDLESRASVHRRATSNGKGAHPPDEGPTP